MYETGGWNQMLLFGFDKSEIRKEGGGQREWTLWVWLSRRLQPRCRRAEWQWRGEKEDMIEWDISSAADVSRSLDWPCVCVCLCVRFYSSVPKSESPWTYSLLWRRHSKKEPPLCYRSSWCLCSFGFCARKCAFVCLNPTFFKCILHNERKRL